jgi:hypothetical protein
MKSPFPNALLTAALVAAGSTAGVADETLTVQLRGQGSGCRVDNSFCVQPLAFEPNLGQVDPEVKFLARGRGYQLFLTATEAVVVLQEPKPRLEAAGSWMDHIPGSSSPGLMHGWTEASPEVRNQTDPGWCDPFALDIVPEPPVSLSFEGVIQDSRVLRMTLAGASISAPVGGEQELPGKVNYFIGNDPTCWRTNISSFARVHYREVYPGTDLVYYGNEGRLEYDLVLAPGANPDLIALQFEGADRMELDAQGNLIAWVAGRPVCWQKPVVYQEKGGQRIDIPASYRLKNNTLSIEPQGNEVIGFELAAYDPTKPLVIDPVLVYSTYLGGTKDDSARAVAVDEQGNAYITGSTFSADFPTKAGLKGTISGGVDVFVAKVSPSGQLLYSTYLGGSGGNQRTEIGEPGETGSGLAVDAGGTCYLTGWTTATNFPLLSPIQPVPGGKSDGFVAALTPDGSALVFSTYLGGSDIDLPAAVALDPSGNIYVGGSTWSTDFPIQNAIQGQNLSVGYGQVDCFVTKLEPRGRGIVYSTYLGGSENDYLRAIAADDEGNAYIAGDTQSGDFPVQNAYQPFLAGPRNMVYAKISPDGSGLLYSSYFGGTDYDWAPALALGSNGSLWITGESGSPGLATPGAYQTSKPDWYNILARFNASDGSLVAATYLNPAVPNSVVVDLDGNVIVGGGAGGSSDCFIAKFSPDLSTMLFSTYLGGNGGDGVSSIALAPNGDLVVLGGTSITNFPTLNAFQPDLKSPKDAFVARISFFEVLKVSRSGQSLVFSWPASASGYILQSATTLSSGGDWQDSNITPSIADGQNVVNLTPTGPRGFFRLRKQ